MKRLLCVFCVITAMLTACSANPVEPQPLTLDDVARLSEKQLSLSWQDFAQYEHEEAAGPEKVVWTFSLDAPEYSLALGGDSTEEPPAYISLRNGEDSIDIRVEDAGAFVDGHQLLPEDEPEPEPGSEDSAAPIPPQKEPEAPLQPPAKAQPSASPATQAPPAGPVYTVAANPVSYDVAAQSISVTITNTSGVEGGYGYAYRIERNAGGNWEALPLEIEVEDIARILPAGQSAVETISLRQEQYAYAPGEYRVVFLDGLNGAACPFVLTGSAAPTYTAVADPERYPVTAGQVTVRITNTSGVEGGYGLQYTVQKKVDGGWETLPFEIEVPDIGVVLPAGKSTTEAYSLCRNQYDYTPGTYRIVLADGLHNAAVQFILQ